ncbi:hypothetical protein ScPMuIL_012244 [Solemya velum]
MTEYVNIYVPSEAGQLDLEVVGDCVGIPAQDQEQEQDDEFDPDQVDMEDILQRLDEYNPLPSDPMIYTSCDCTSTDKTSYVPLEGQHDSSDTEAEDIVLDDMLSMLGKFEHVNSAKLSCRAIGRLIKGFHCQETITEKQHEQVWTYLHNSDSVFKEYAILLCHQICMKSENVTILLEAGVLQVVESLIVSCVWNSLYLPAVNLLDKLMLGKSFIENVPSLEFTVSNIIPLLCSHLQSNLPLDYKYSVCCCFRTLARYDYFCPLILESVLPIVSYLQNATAKLKEVYTEILTEVVSYFEEINLQLINASVIPSMRPMVRDGPCGPQMKALHLLMVVTGMSSACVASVIADKQLLCHILWCLKTSTCRLVGKSAVALMQNLTGCRKLGLCKELMVEMAQTLLTEGRPQSWGSQQITFPARLNARYGKEIQIWNGLEEFIDILVKLLDKEARVERSEMGTFLEIAIDLRTNVVPKQLQTIQKILSTLENICLWPLDPVKSGSSTKVNLTHFTDCPTQRRKFSKVNQILTSHVWGKVGKAVMAMLDVYARRIKYFSGVYQEMKLNNISNSSKHSRLASLSDTALLKTHREKKFFAGFKMDIDRLEKTFSKKGLVQLEELFKDSEVELIECLLNLVLCVSLCCCGEFITIKPRDRAKHGNMNKGTSCFGNDTKQEKKIVNRVQSDSLFCHSFKMTSSKVKAQSRSPGHGRPLQFDHLKTDENMECRKLRKCLYEADIFSSICPFLTADSGHVQVLSLQILRCCIQPLEEKISSKFSNNCIHSTVASRSKRRPMSAAGTVKERNQQLNLALHKMSPDLAGLIRDAIGPRPQSAMIKQLQPITEQVTESDLKSPPRNDRSLEEDVRPVIDSSQPVAWQCRHCLIRKGGNNLLTTLFTSNRDVRKQCVTLLHDLVHYGEVHIHMELCGRGFISKLLDFLRVNDEDENLEIIGLIVVRMMVSSDERIKALFHQQGGSALLVSMAQYTTGILRQEVSTTLKSVTRNISAKGTRPKSAPVHSQTARDIWDNISHRWKEEDRVTRILRQWMK